jgi:hypothetical protein
MHRPLALVVNPQKTSLLQFSQLIVVKQTTHPRVTRAKSKRAKPSQTSEATAKERHK